jgi:hypothetical protein
MSITRGENFHIPLHNSSKRTQSFFRTSAVEIPNERTRFSTTLPQPHGGATLPATRRSKQAVADFQPAEGKGELRGRENGLRSQRLRTSHRNFAPRTDGDSPGTAPLQAAATTINLPPFNHSKNL